MLLGLRRQLVLAAVAAAATGPQGLPRLRMEGGSAAGMAAAAVGLEGGRVVGMISLVQREISSHITWLVWPVWVPPQMCMGRWEAT